ncbi:electron transfer flavoprotein subunit alpha/FixB family protein [Clostridium sp. ZS2-4]|uniref:electron transfer flavoprotein subunit alpha/FixB family protein n=1 Tax=Clostridium sp. ZS2-4 TaxID=2987703 RepID=UPI00227C824F|nr:electron transfer flavoprotein subunit alpha/FixB family protein [Clostridium sp. ZS2-4]MCY6354217.1 electron transfer flavoprotein subunit alpha/FixB family protein [Clostridium sp. ZS2-4]
MKKSLIYLDEENHKNSIDLLEVVRQIYGEEGNETYGICVNHYCRKAEGAFDKLIQVSENEISEKDPMIITDIMEELHGQYEFDCILIPATQFGRMLAPRLAMRLKVGLVADVTAIHNHNRVVEMVRPAFSGKIMAGIVKNGDGPYMMSVRQNVFTYNNKSLKDTQVIAFHPVKRRNSSLKLLETRKKIQSYDIRDSKVLVSGGGGTSKNFKKLELLAKELNGQVSASRKIIDKGIAPREIQVGQSGKTVNPKLYIALGINGAIQHIEGLKNVDHIISINTNKSAPICSLSDLVVEGDAFEFIDKLVEKIKANK